MFLRFWFLVNSILTDFRQICSTFFKIIFVGSICYPNIYYRAINYKQLSISLAISLGIGGLPGLITMMGMESFKNANKPPLTPPDFLFPIVLTILLWLLIILMIKWVTFAAYLNIGLAECRSGIEI